MIDLEDDPGFVTQRSSTPEEKKEVRVEKQEDVEIFEDIQVDEKEKVQD